MAPSPIGNYPVSPSSVLAVTSRPQYKLHIRTVKLWGTLVPFRATASFAWSTQSKVDLLLFFRAVQYPASAHNQVSNASSFLNPAENPTFPASSKGETLASPWASRHVYGKLEQWSCRPLCALWHLLLKTGRYSEPFQSVGHCLVFHIC